MKTSNKLLVVLLFSLLASSLSAQETPKLLKFDFFAPVAGCMGFSYEQPKSDFVSIDYDLGFIGIKLDDYFNYETFVGAYCGAGPRLYFKKDAAELNDGRGMYFKPMLMLNYFHFTEPTSYWDGYNTINRDVVGDDFTINVLATMGTQWIMADKIVFDLWFGLGYGGGWNSSDAPIVDGYAIQDYDNPFKFSYVRFGYSPMIFDGGLSIGLKW